MYIWVSGKFIHYTRNSVERCALNTKADATERNPDFNIFHIVVVDIKYELPGRAGKETKNEHDQKARATARKICNDKDAHKQISMPRPHNEFMNIWDAQDPLFA